MDGMRRVAPAHRGGHLVLHDDPDGNQLFFNYPNESASGK
jgi:hypothetical protein